MAKGSMWAGIAAAANSIGGILQAREADSRKEKLYLMEQDIMQKRQEALAQLRGDIQDNNAANRSDRALNRLQFKQELEAGNITGGYEDKETGNYYGRTKGGQMVPLHVTSDEYQQGLAAIQKGKANVAEMAPEKTQAQINQTNASTNNLNSITERRDATPLPTTKDPQGDKIRSELQKQIDAARAQNIREADAARKAGTAPPPAFDPNSVTEQAMSQLYSVYGADAVKSAVGAGANRDTGAKTGDRPTVEQLLASANAAIKAGKDPKAVEARLQELYAKYGYETAKPSFGNVQAGASYGQ